jgi:dihydrofolate reductase
MIISFIAAVSENNVIGKAGKLPWHLPADMQYFKNTTWALPVIMGRKTFESFPRALQGRTNIVITRQAGYSAENMVVAGNVEEAIEKAVALKTEEIFIIGGGEIYKQAWDVADRLYITRVHTVVEGDAF